MAPMCPQFQTARAVLYPWREALRRFPILPLNREEKKERRRLKIEPKRADLMILAEPTVQSSQGTACVFTSQAVPNPEPVFPL